MNSKGQQQHPQQQKGAWVIIDKPTGMRCMAVTNGVRKALGVKKAGHAGTLDPLAEGILPIALGKATKSIAEVVSQRKAYRFVVRWGIGTDTLDAEGDVIESDDVRPSKEQIIEAMRGFHGVIRQHPPLFSALRVQGVRAHALAREKTALELLPREVTLYELHLEEQDSESATFFCLCGQGFYVRALARDLGKAVGGCAHITALRRVAVGGIDGQDAIGYQELWDLCKQGRGQEAVLSMAEMTKKLYKKVAKDAPIL
ncbi:MAG: tRNA pseudouridine(55) synthase TruB [Alphaproteobacteria bacterium GM202ARS2]|nr:tRNA pseudouridine(55) synthase TruB [Alphaproteobacteria bacterium GM202ARS2]